MPNIMSAAKRARQAEKHRARNRGVKSAIHSERRLFLAAIEAKDKDKALQLFRRFGSVLDKAVKHGIIPKNTGDRSKSRASRQLAKLA